MLLAATLASVMLGSAGCSTMKAGARKVGRLLHIIDDPSEDLWRNAAAPSAMPIEMPEAFRRGQELLAEEKFAEALETLDAYLRDEPTEAYTQAAMLASGRALQGLQRWSDASERYRRVVVACEGVAPRLQAMALYHLSFCQEALGEDQKTVATLHDLLSRSNHLPEEVARAELPARLAAAYARVGNFDKAFDYYASAESGIVKLRRQRASNDVPIWLPRSLYFMGALSLRRVGWDDFETALRPLARSQVYLLQSAEFDVVPWSEKSAKDLMSIYQHLWDVIASASVAVPEDGDPVLAQRELQVRQWDRAILVLEHLQDLKARAMPGEHGQQTKNMGAFVADLEKKVHALLAERPAGEGLTEASRDRRKRARGVVVAPDDSLERRFLESARRAKGSEP